MRILFGLSLLVGCTTSHGGGGTMTGPGSFMPMDTISASVTSGPDGAGGTSQVARIVMATTSGLCTDASASPPVDRKNQTYLVIELANVFGARTETPSAPGTYTIYPNSGSRPAASASFVFGGFDATCQPNDGVAASGQSGTVTLAAISSTGVFTGSFDVVMNTDAHLTGTFQPDACPALQTEATSIAEHSCI